MSLRKILEDYVLMSQETGGDASASGSLVGDSGAEGNGAEGGEGAGADPASQGDQQAAAGEGEGQPGGGEGDVEGDAPAGAPESYEQFNIPEGFNVSEENLGAFQEFAKGLNLTQEGAQQLIDYHTDILKNAMGAQAQLWADTRKEWVDTAKSDQEYGGQKFQENMKHVSVALDKFGTPALKEALNDLGLGDHPEVVRFFYRVGKAVGAPGFRTGNGDSAGNAPAEKILYPDMN